MSSADLSQHHVNENEGEVVFPKDRKLDAILDGSTPLTSEDHRLFHSLLLSTLTNSADVTSSRENSLREASLPKKEEPFVISA